MSREILFHSSGRILVRGNRVPWFALVLAALRLPRSADTKLVLNSSRAAVRVAGYYAALWQAFISGGTRCRDQAGTPPGASPRFDPVAK